MILKALKTELKEILPFRALFLQENDFQIRYNACHERNWSDSYIFTIDDVKIGYGSIKGKDKLTDRDAVFEFYVIPSYRELSHVVFQELLTTSGACFIECQSNDRVLSFLLYEFSQNINAETILFDDHLLTDYKMQDVIFRHRSKEDFIFEHTFEPIGDYVLEMAGEIVGTGGFMLHYNKPFADLYMEVKENFRGKGYGSLMIQELKKECYLSDRVPAARCNILNLRSKYTLIKGGLKVCGYMLTGEVKASLRK